MTNVYPILYKGKWNNFIHFRFEVNFSMLNGQRREREDGQRALGGSFSREDPQSYHTSAGETELGRDGVRIWVSINTLTDLMSITGTFWRGVRWNKDTL